MNFLEKLQADYLDSKRLTLAEVKKLCPSCGEKMEANGMTHLNLSEEVSAAIKDDLKKWAKYWKSLTGKAEHKFTKCMKKLEGVKGIKNPKGLCGKLKSQFG